MKQTKRKLLLALAIAAALIGVGVSPAVAQTAAPSNQAGNETPPPGFSAEATEPEMPLTMTDEEMEEWAAGGGSTTTQDSVGARAAVGDFCTLAPGQVWRRSSAKGLPNGGVGGKPSLTNCTAGVTETKLTSYVYMHNGWIWERKGGPYIAYGHGNMEQKNVLYPCANTNDNSFRVASVGWGKNAAGRTHEATDLSDTYTLQCG
jgi:hypothetical protein